MPLRGRMSESRSVLRCASVVTLVAALTHLFHPSCSLGESQGHVTTSAKWGTVLNLRSRTTRFGDEFTASEINGRHRVLLSTKIIDPGRYRISIDARYVGSSQMALEAGGPHQPYGIVTVNLQTGTIEKVERDVLAAGVESLPGEGGAYRWWMDMALNPGEFDYNFALLSVDRQHDFLGTEICKFVLSNPLVRRLPEAQVQ